MFASAYFRREGLGPGSSDRPGTSGARAPQAAASPLVCCVKTSRTFWFPLAKRKTVKRALQMQLSTHAELCSKKEVSFPDS